MATVFSVGGLSHNAFDIDANGLYLYLAVLDASGNPQVLKMLADLTANATVSYNPGAGSEVNLMAGDLSSYYVWAVGAFAGTDKVVLTQDGGNYWYVQDEGTWSGVARPVLVGPGDDLLLTTSTDLYFWQNRFAGGDIYWVERTLPGTIWAVDRLDDNFDNTIIGAYWYTGDSSQLVHYSPNSGFNWENVTGVLTPPKSITAIAFGR